MNKLQSAQLGTLTLPLAHLENNEEITKTVPALAPIILRAKTLVTTILFNDQKIISKTEGIIDDKEADQAQLTLLSIVISSAIVSYASVNNNPELREAMRFNKTELFYGPDKELGEQCTIILENARNLGDKLKDYGVSPALVNSYSALIDDYSVSVEKPRSSIAERKAAGTRVSRLIKEAKTLFEDQLDPLMQQFRLTHLTFFEEYEAKRVLIDPPRRHTRLAGTVTDEATGLPLKDVSVQVEGQQYSAITDEAGIWAMKIPLTGKQKLVLKKPGYNDLQAEARLVKGRVVTTDLKMKPL